MKDVDYAYHNGTKVFDHAAMEAHPQEIVALMGPSGEGKTTMLRLMLSLMPIKSGRAVLCAGGRTMEEADEGQMLALSPATRRLFAYVPQGNTMFSGTIAENMRNVKPDATDEEIIDVLKRACAWEFVAKLPDGINSMVKEQGRCSENPPFCFWTRPHLPWM